MGAVALENVTTVRMGVERNSRILTDFRERRRKDMAKDPVCAMDVDEQKAAATSDYKGQTIYFCAKGCKVAFDKDPEKYLAGDKG